MTARLPTLLLLAALLPGDFRADELELTDGGVLSGSVVSISPDGVITADLEISKGIAKIHADKMKRVRFGKDGRKFDHDAILTLVNGDRVPCDVLAINEDELKVETGFAGTLSIPRGVVRTAELGIRPRRTIYRGPENLAGWKVGDNWHFEEDSLVSDGRGSISREIGKLPSSYSLSFNLAWGGKPNFQVYFSSDTTASSGGKHDRYYLQFGAAGMEIKRQSSGRSGYQSLLVVNRSNETFPAREAGIEIRVDHRQRMLFLYVDGELEGQAPDPLEVAPEGNIIVFQSNASEAEAHRVSEIRIREWDAAGDRHRSEDRGDFGEDALINNEGQRFGGRLVRSEGEGQDMKLFFKSPLSPQPLEIPTPEVSTLFFEESNNGETEATPLVLGLGGSGSLSALACDFKPEVASLTHPLLGSLEIKRSNVTLLERRDEPDTEE